MSVDVGNARFAVVGQIPATIVCPAVVPAAGVTLSGLRIQRKHLESITPDNTTNFSPAVAIWSPKYTAVRIA